MGWFTDLTGFIAPFFLIMSPIFSYSDQIISMHRNKSSTGFSLDIPLIMLVASFLRIFYWPYQKYDMALLVQSILMVIIQVILLKVALDHRPSSSTKGGEAALPFAGANDGIMSAQRPYNFWQWRAPKPFWHCIMYFVAGLVVLELFLSHVPGLYDVYASTIGPIGLAVEATLPIPQILSNLRTKSCKGFRLSVVASWIIGDAMKLYWFFTATTPIPWAFKVCGIFQGSCDAFLGVQYYIYGDGQVEVKGHPLVEGNWSAPHKEPTLRSHSRSLTPSRRPAPFSDAEMTE